MNYFKKMMIAVLSYEGVLLLSLLTFGEFDKDLYYSQDPFLNHHPSNTANAQNNCQDDANSIIGSDNQGEYGAERVGGRLYLNTDNPAPCGGFITQLEYCYYPPESDNELQILNSYQVFFAIYRQQANQDRYQRRTVLRVVCDRREFIGELDEDFPCTIVNISRTRVQQGDIIGACLPGGNSLQLDVVSNVSDEDFNANLSYIDYDCSSIRSTLPSFVNEHNLGVQERRILHLYARITCKLYYTVLLSYQFDDLCYSTS